jgi:hypothetical protein
MSLQTILVIVLILILIGGVFPFGGGPVDPNAGRPFYYGYGFGGGFGGILGIVLVIVLILALLGRL